MNDLAQRIRKILPPNMESGIAASEIVAEWIEKQDFYWPKEKRRESAEKLFDDCIAFSDLSDWKKAIDRAFGIQDKSLEDKMYEVWLGTPSAVPLKEVMNKLAEIVREHDAR